MNFQRISRKSPISLRTISLFLLIGAVIAYVWFVPPLSLFTILPFIVLISSTVFLIAGIVTTHKLQILITVFCGVFLLMNAIIGFDLINTILLVSFIIAIGFLLK